MEDSISNLRDFFELSFQSKLEVIAKRRQTPDLKDLLQALLRNNRSF